MRRLIDLLSVKLVVDGSRDWGLYVFDCFEAGVSCLYLLGKYFWFRITLVGVLMDPSLCFLNGEGILSLFSLFFMQSSSLLGVFSFGVSMQRSEIALAAL